MPHKLEITMFGTCIVRVVGDHSHEVRGVKHRGLFALLATAPLGRRTRTFLQQTLWGDAGYDSGHQNLRRALSDLRSAMGPAFDDLLHTTNSDIELDLEKVEFVGNPNAGPFLDGLNIRERAFVDWVQGIRENPASILGVVSPEETTAPMRAKPRVTALPLKALGDDPNLPILGDWVAEETCRSLSRSNLMTVISHLSSRAMANRLIDIAEVRDTLDVDYIVTGTLRHFQGDLVADFDFIDAHSGGILWNRHISCPAGQFTDQLQGQLVNVIQSIGRTLADAAIRYVRDRPLPMVEDHQLVIAGVSLMHRSRMRDFLKSKDLLEEALRRAPKSAETYAWMGKWYVLSVFNGWTTDRDGDVQKALDATARSLDMDPDSSFSLTIDGFAHNNLLMDMDTAADRYHDALAINPNESLSWLLRGALMAFRNNGSAAIKGAETARLLSPIDPFGYFYDSLASTAYVAAEDYEKALDFAERSLRINDRHISTLRTKTTALYYLDRMEEARETAQEIIRRQPDFRMDQYKRSHPSAHHESGKRVIEALEAAGLK